MGLPQCKLFVQSVVDFLFTFSQQNHCQLWDWFFDWFVDQVCSDQQPGQVVLSCFLVIIVVSLSQFCLPTFLIIDAQAAKHPWLAFVADLSNNDSLIPDNGNWSVEAVDVAAPAGNSICTDCSHLYPSKGKFCEPSADWQNLGAQSWWQRSNIKTTTI